MKLFADSADLSSYSGALTVTSNMGDTASTLTFSLPKDRGEYGTPYIPICGSIVSLFLCEEVFRGIVVSVDDGAKDVIRYTACDYGFYLNKNKEVYQFSGVRADDAIRRICSDFGIPVYRIANIAFRVDGIYTDQTVSEIIGDILERAEAAGGSKYGFEVQPKGLAVYRVDEEAVAPVFHLADNLAAVDGVKHRGSVSHKISIEDMRNAVKIVSGEEQGYTLLAEKRDEANIAKFGRLQDVVTADNDMTDPHAAAAAQLESLRYAKETFSFTVPVDEDVFLRPGRALTVDGTAYIIDSVRQEWKNGLHTAVVSLERRSA